MMSSLGVNGRPGQYQRVPTGDNSTSAGLGGDHAAADDALQQSLLNSPPNSGGEMPEGNNLGTAPSSLGGDPASNNRGTWESPQQLHRVVKSLLESWNIIFPYIRPMGTYLYCLTILTMLVVVPLVTYKSIEEDRFDMAAFDSAGVMVLGTLVLSFRLIYLHLTHWYMPQVQKYVVRIVWMVPLYAVQSWLSLKYRDARIYIDAIRDLYEAFVIASFLYYLMELLGGQDALVRILESKREAQPHLGKHPWPLKHLLHDWELGTEFMMQCKHGVLQYVVVKTVVTFFTYIFEYFDVYGEGEFKWDTAYPYMAFLLNTSVMYALYVLVMLFHAVREELNHPVNWRPLGKFLCVKGVVFFTWWQGVIILYLQNKGYIKDTKNWTGHEISNALVDYCVCTEMVFFAVAHSYTFTYKEYLPSSIPPELRNLTLNASVNATVNAAHPDDAAAAPQPLRLEAIQSTMSSASAHSAVKPTYQPPAVLDEPLNFKEAFWSSSIPKETFADLNGLRTRIDSIARGRPSSGSISLQEIQTEADAAVAAATATGNMEQAAAAAEVAAAAMEAANQIVPTIAEEQSVDIEEAGGGSTCSTGENNTTSSTGR